MPKKKGKRKTKRPGQGSSRPLRIKENGQEYAVVLKLLGDRRVNAYCYDGKERICKICGSMRKRVWIKIDDYVLISIRSFEDDKGDIIHKYTPEEVRKLKKKEDLVDARIQLNNEFVSDDDDNVGFDFEEI